MPEQQQPFEERELWPDRRTAMNRAALVLDVLSCVWWPFGRSRPGVMQPGLAGGLTFIALPLWGMQTQNQTVMQFWMAWTVALILYRLRKTRKVYSLDPGLSWLFKRFGRWAETAEAAFVLSVGWLVYQKDEPLGLVFLASGVALAINEMLASTIRRKRQIAADDAAILARVHMRR